LILIYVVFSILSQISLTYVVSLFPLKNVIFHLNGSSPVCNRIPSRNLILPETVYAMFGSSAFSEIPSSLNAWFYLTGLCYAYTRELVRDHRNAIDC